MNRRAYAVFGKLLLATSLAACGGPQTNEPIDSTSNDDTQAADVIAGHALKFDFSSTTPVLRDGVYSADDLEKIRMSAADAGSVTDRSIGDGSQRSVADAARWQRTWRPGATCAKSCGASHSDCAAKQRGRKLHPRSMRLRSGRLPGIGTSRER